jgi:hypothetical protein
MLTMRHHNSRDYTALPDIDETDAGTISADDQACLDEIGNCLLRAKAHLRFGATLLHSHFPVENEETLLEEVQTDAQMITLRPVRNEASGLFATNVSFDNADARGGELRLVGLEFASREALAGVAPISDSDCNVLTHIGIILHRHVKTGRFGVRLLHDPLNLSGGVLLETCDPVHRVLTCRSAMEDDPAFVQSVATVFCWEEVQAGSEDGLVIGQECIQLCKRVQRCEKSVHGSHKESNNHESTGHRSY